MVPITKEIREKPLSGVVFLIGKGNTYIGKLPENTHMWVFLGSVHYQRIAGYYRILHELH
jgi:hypothetical protein